MKRELIKMLIALIFTILMLAFFVILSVSISIKLLLCFSTATILGILLYFKLEDYLSFNQIFEHKDEIIERLKKKNDPYTVKQTRAIGKYKDKYYLRSSILSSCEVEFFKALQQVIPSEYSIAPKVHLCDIFGEMSGFKDWKGYTRHRHIDFLIIEKKTARPVLGIELDDPTHDNIHTQKRDKFKDDIFYSSQIPLFREGVKPEYSLLELEGKIAQKLKGK